MKDEKDNPSFKDYPIYANPVVPGNTIFFLPNGSRTKNLETGEVVKLAPGYYVNPRQLAVITNVK